MKEDAKIAQTSLTPEAIEAVKRRGQEWLSSDASKHRIYFDNATRLKILYPGLRASFYGTGRVSAATMDGERISNSAAAEYLHDVATCTVWFDFADQEFHLREEGKPDCRLKMASCLAALAVEEKAVEK